MSDPLMAKRKREGQGAYSPPPLRGLTETQESYLNALRVSPQVFAIGPAGTGKTWLAAAYAADLLKNKQVSQIVLTRPNVPAGPSLGFFPGELEDKMAPWVRPFTDTISERMGRSHFENDLKNGRIEIVPFETMRGMSFRDAFIIVDEAQNLTETEMYMILTRVGEDSQIVVTGDLVQKDIKESSGLAKAISLIKRNAVRAELIQFTANDIVRGGICAEWVRAWNTENTE